MFQFSNNSAVRRQNGEYAVNGHRILNWSGRYKVAGVEVKYKRFKDNIRETIEISGPTKEDIYVKVSDSVSDKLCSLRSPFLLVNGTNCPTLP